jgi:hypothetical protein
VLQEYFMSKEVFNAFVNCINEKDLDGMYSMMAQDHIFIDAHGNKLQGAEMMKESWAEYFAWFPDYFIEVENIMDSDTSVSGFGYASATYNGNNTTELKNNNNCFRLPSAFRAHIQEGKIIQWQVYSDTKTVFEIIKKNS